MENMASTLSMQRMSGIFWQSGTLPEEERYDGYLQLENGVGMLRLLEDGGSGGSLEALEGDDRKRELSMATGRLAAPFIEASWQDYLKRNIPDTARFMCMRCAMISSESRSPYPG